MSMDTEGEYSNKNHRLKVKKAKVKFTKEHAQKDSSFWRPVLFSDESACNWDGSKSRVFLWRKSGNEFQSNCTKGYVQRCRGGWGCFPTVVLVTVCSLIAS